MRRSFLVAVASASLAGPVLAHEGGVDAKGTVKAITADRIDVQTGHGEKSFALTPSTEFVKGRAPAKASDIRPGDRVVVHARMADGALKAILVRAGAEKAPAKNQGAAPVR
jgi:Domain of unknown function (DUF5666)